MVPGLHDPWTFPTPTGAAGYRDPSSSAQLRLSTQLSIDKKITGYSDIGLFPRMGGAFTRISARLHR
jgi:hypothetical protein